MAAQKVIIDTDPGIDDAMAILLACVHDDVDLIGLTTIFGNVTTDVATRNALRLAELAGQEIPVARGAEAPLKLPARPVAAEVHGREGFGHVPPARPGASPVGRSAAEFICETVSAHPGEIVLCPIGPLTNLALALQHDPSIAHKVKSVTVMGGSVAEGGNVTEHAEANIWQDPHAAEIVFAAPWDVTLVGLDVTHKVICDAEDFAGLTEPAPRVGGFLNDAVQFYLDFHHAHLGYRACHMHDPTAVISILRPDLFLIEENRLAVALDGHEVGRTVVSGEAGRNPTRVCMGVDDEAVRAMFLSTIRSSF